MSLLYAAGVDTAQVGTMSVVVSGAGAGTATLVAGTYCHVSLATVTGASAYTALAAAVQTALNVVVAGWTVAYSSTTNRYTISHASPFVLTWTGAAGERLRKVLGYAGTTASGTSAVGTLAPWYTVVPLIQARSLFSDVYEPDEIVEEQSAEDDTTTSIAKMRGTDFFDFDDQIMWCDWTQAMESRAQTMIAGATTEWTWERFFKHCRGEHPFLVIDGASSTVHKLRAKGAMFGERVRTRVAVDYNDLWSIRLETRQLVGSP